MAVAAHCLDVQANILAILLQHFSQVHTEREKYTGLIIQLNLSEEYNLCQINGVFCIILNLHLVTTHYLMLWWLNSGVMKTITIGD